MIGWVSNAASKLWTWYNGLLAYFNFGGAVEQNADMEAGLGGVGGLADGVHTFGDMSVAYRSVANSVYAKCCLQVHASRTSTFLGLYDGHGESNEAAKFLGRYLHFKITDRVRLGAPINLELIASCISEMETEYKDYVEATPDLAVRRTYAFSGCSCVVIVILVDKILVANVGDGKCICVREYGVFSIRMTTTYEALNMEKNLNSKTVRDELVSKLVISPNLVLREGTWRLNDQVEISESIGNLNLKYAESGEDLEAPLLSMEVHTKTVNRSGYIRYLVLASHEFWEVLSEKQVIAVVKKMGRKDIAQHLMDAVVKESVRVGRLLSRDVVIAVVFLDDVEPKAAFADVTLGNVQSLGGGNVTAYHMAF